MHSLCRERCRGRPLAQPFLLLAVVTNETQVLVEIQDDPTQIVGFFLNLHDCCPHYTTKKNHLKVTVWQIPSESLPGMGIPDGEAAGLEGPARC